MWGFIFLLPVCISMHRCSFFRCWWCCCCVVSFYCTCLYLFWMSFYFTSFGSFCFFSLYVRWLNCKIYINMLTFISSAACAWHYTYIYNCKSEKERKRSKTLRYQAVTLRLSFFNTSKQIETNCDNLIQICFSRAFLWHPSFLIFILECTDFCRFSL